MIVGVMLRYTAEIWAPPPPPRPPHQHQVVVVPRVWSWQVGASNELLYVNSLKLKLSVLFGGFPMIVGVMLRYTAEILASPPPPPPSHQLQVVVVSKFWSRVRCSNATKSRNLTDFVSSASP